jgi:biotin operon repressor
VVSIYGTIDTEPATPVTGESREVVKPHPSARPAGPGRHELAASSRDGPFALRRVERHQRIVEILVAAGESVSAAVLADRLGVGLRTVERDVRRLREAGVPLQTRRGRGGGITLPVTRGVRRVDLDVGEIAALLASLASLGPTVTDVATSANTALVAALGDAPLREADGGAT